MSTQQTTDADLIERVMDAMYPGLRGNIPESIARDVIAAVRPLIEAQARAEGRVEALRNILDEIRFARIPATAGPKFHYWCGMTEACSMIDKRLKALDTGAAADEEERPEHGDP